MTLNVTHTKVASGGNIVEDTDWNDDHTVTGDTMTLGTTIVSNNKTVTTAGTAVTLVASSTPCIEVTITPLSTNLGDITIGGSTTKATSTVKGELLSDKAVISIDDVSKIYIDASISGEGVSFRYIND
jgi:hypothetical protein